MIDFKKAFPVSLAFDPMASYKDAWDHYHDVLNGSCIMNFCIAHVLQLPPYDPEATAREILQPSDLFPIGSDHSMQKLHTNW